MQNALNAIDTPSFIAIITLPKHVLTSLLILGLQRYTSFTIVVLNLTITIAFIWTILKRINRIICARDTQLGEKL